VLARDQRFIERLVDYTLKAGYGENHAHWGQERKIAAIAVPVMQGPRVMGCLNLVYIAKAMSIEEAARRYLRPIQNVVSKIEAGLAAS
jgi:IclR family mhp operon transcriptional activator